MKGTIFFDVVNKECVPQDSFTGGQNVPNTGYDFEMTRVDNKTWTGYFYRDAFQDDDYFGQGFCQWDATGVAADFSVRGENFSSSFLLKDFLNGPQARYFKRSAYGDQALVKYGVQNYSAKDVDVIQHTDAYFTITVTVKEATP